MATFQSGDRVERVFQDNFSSGSSRFPGDTDFVVGDRGIIISLTKGETNYWDVRLDDGRVSYANKHTNLNLVKEDYLTSSTCSGTTLTAMVPINYPASWAISTGSSCGVDYQKIINKTKKMTTKEIIKAIFTGEPKKSRMKAGIVNNEGDLTCEGREIYLNYLFSKEKADSEFDTTIVGPVIAEMEKNDK